MNPPNINTLQKQVLMLVLCVCLALTKKQKTINRKRPRVSQLSDLSISDLLVFDTSRLPRLLAIALAEVFSILAVFEEITNLNYY